MAMAAKPCLLVVDDEPDLVQSVKDLLRFEYRVLGATRASEGLRIMSAETVQIVMSDQRMPEMTGVEFLSSLKNTHPDTVRLLFTAYADLSAVIDAINEGNVYRYIAKPWVPDELRTVLRQALEYHTLQTERKRLLEELQQKNAQLETANAELRRANELKRAFIRVASHELRTPLTIVLGLSELSARAPEAPPALKGWLQQACQAGGRLSDRVDQMVKLLQSERFERPLQPRPTDLAGLLRGAAQEVDSFVTLRGQHLDLALAGDLGSIDVEPDKLHDALVQLLMNAVKFTPDGGKIRLAASRAAAEVRIEVSDTGIGIDADTQARLFEPFCTRLDVTRHSSGTFEFDRRGLGLGLAVAKAFVEMHGGRIAAASSPGDGTRFTITLPTTPRGESSGGTGGTP
jgi:signal transduction histidine kinase